MASVTTPYHVGLWGLPLTHQRLVHILVEVIPSIVDG